MKRVVCAALAAVLGWAAPAGAQLYPGYQTIFSFDGYATSSFNQVTQVTTPENAYFHAVAFFGPNAANGDTAFVSFSGPGVVNASGPGTGTITKVSDLEYLLTANGGYLDSFADFNADLKLASPLAATPGRISFLPSSSIALYTRLTSYTAVLYSVSTAVPEASTWAMMLVGMGLVGAALRRRPAVRYASPVTTR